MPLDSWSGIVSNYLKPENFKASKGNFVVEDIKARQSKNDKGETVIKLEIYTTVGGVEYVFIPNYTNSKFLKSKVKTPQDLLGKKLFFEKIKVRNPQTNATVDSLSIVSIDKLPTENEEEEEVSEELI